VTLWIHWCGTLCVSDPRCVGCHHVSLTQRSSVAVRVCAGRGASSCLGVRTSVIMPALACVQLRCSSGPRDALDERDSDDESAAPPSPYVAVHAVCDARSDDVMLHVLRCRRRHPVQIPRSVERAG
jgi:hypothetical protein